MCTYTIISVWNKIEYVLIYHIYKSIYNIKKTYTSIKKLHSTLSFWLALFCCVCYNYIKYISNLKRRANQLSFFLFIQRVGKSYLQGYSLIAIHL